MVIIIVRFIIAVRMVIIVRWFSGVIMVTIFIVSIIWFSGVEMVTIFRFTVLPIFTVLPFSIITRFTSCRGQWVELRGKGGKILMVFWNKLMGIEVDRFWVDIRVQGVPVGPVGPLPQSVVIAGHCKGSLVVSIREGVVGYGWVGKTKVGVG